VIGKAEVMKEGENPRFVVTNLPANGFKDDKDKTRFSPARLYEELYCARAIWRTSSSSRCWTYTLTG